MCNFALAAEPLPAGILAYSLPVPLLRVIGIALLETTPNLPTVYAFLDTLRRRQFQNLA